MGVLRRLLLDWRTRRPAVPTAPTVAAKPSARASAPPATTASPRDALVKRVRQLCAGGHAVTAGNALSASTYQPLDPEDSLRLVHEVVAPILEACIAKGSAAAGCEVERIAYGRFIKAFELPHHYEACFDVLDPLMTRLGAGSTAGPSSRQGPATASRLLFFVHNASTEMAHIPLLCDVLDSFLAAARPEEGPSIGIAGWFGDAYAPRIQQLAERWGVQLLATNSPESSGIAYDEAAQLVLDGRFDRIVVVAAPTGISYLTGILGPGQVAWYSMKFEIDSFTLLEHRCSFMSSPTVQTRDHARFWRRAPPFLTHRVDAQPSGASVPALERSRAFSTLFYTVNREHKIRHPQYLDAVCCVLEAVPGSCFLWTGRERLADIDAFFERRGLLDRTLFAGWVNPDDLVVAGGVFLDTPVLSGTVAARAAVLGFPVVTWTGAQSWVNAFMPIFDADQDEGRTPPALGEAMRSLHDAGGALECATPKQYVALAVRLSADPSFRSLHCDTLKAFTEHHFYDQQRWAEQHMSNLRAGLGAQALNA